MPDIRPQRSLVRWSVVALVVIVLLMIAYWVTHGFGAMISSAPPWCRRHLGYTTPLPCREHLLGWLLMARNSELPAW